MMGRGRSSCVLFSYRLTGSEETIRLTNVTCCEFQKYKSRTNAAYDPDSTVIDVRPTYPHPQSTTCQGCCDTKWTLSEAAPTGFPEKTS